MLMFVFEYWKHIPCFRNIFQSNSDFVKVLLPTEKKTCPISPFMAWLLTVGALRDRDPTDFAIAFRWRFARGMEDVFIVSRLGTDKSVNHFDQQMMYVIIVIYSVCILGSSSRSASLSSLRIYLQSQMNPGIICPSVKGVTFVYNNSGSMEINKFGYSPYIYIYI